MSPIVGIPACARLVVNGQLRHDTPARYPAAVLGGAGAVPILLPPMGEASLAACLVGQVNHSQPHFVTTISSLVKYFSSGPALIRT